jgi:hypothetical protein
MNISHRLAAAALAFCLFGNASAFARPLPHSENSGPSYEKKSAAGHVPTMGTSGATGYMRHPPANPVRDDWPNNMILG